MTKFPKTTKIEVRMEDELLEKIPQKGRNKWINDACRDKVNTDVSSAASIMGKIGGSRTSEKKTAAARENAKKPRPRKSDIVSE